MYLEEQERLKETLKRYKDTTIIVEGNKDKTALEKLGLHKAICLRGSVFSFCEKIALRKKEVAILTDLDKEGRKLYSALRKNLERNGVKIDDSLRDIIFSETQVSQI